MPTSIALSQYTLVWLYVLFDLPTETKQNRHDAARFRKDRLADGFTMMQFSVYIRHCASNESGTVHINRVKNLVPAEGLVSIVKVTDRQFGDMINITGRKKTPSPKPPDQLQLF